LVAITAGTAAVAGITLPWARNPVLPDRSGVEVLFGERTSVPLAVSVILLGSIVVAAAGRFGGRTGNWITRGVGTAAGLASLGCLGWYAVQITAESVRAYVMDGAGRVFEPEAASRLGAGWYITAAALLALTFAAAAAPGPASRRDPLRS